MSPFENELELVEWLQAQGVDTRAWNHGRSKSVSNLLAEIQRGETRLETDPLRRYVAVAQVIVRRGKQILIEAGQVFADGRSRPRNRLPSEKLRPGEDPLAAAVRCLVEELAVAAHQVTLYPETYRKKQILVPSDSYPGLQTQYCFHRIEAHVIGLPDTSFSTSEQSTQPGEPVRKHLWEWRDAAGL